MQLILEAIRLPRLAVLPCIGIPLSYRIRSGSDHECYYSSSVYKEEANNISRGGEFSRQ